MEGPNFQAGPACNRQIPGVKHILGAAPMEPVFRSRKERWTDLPGVTQWCVVNRLSPPAGSWRVNKGSIDSRKNRRIRAVSTRIPGPRVLRRSGTGKPALRPQRPACLTALEQRSRTVTAARSAMATRQQRNPEGQRIYPRQTTASQRRRPLRGTPLAKRATRAPAARRCRFAASLSPAPIARHGCSAAHPAHNAGRARRVSSPVSTAGAVEASVTHALLADCAPRG